ncbi:two-component sensor histidine kinase [Cellulomonas sp. zg-ZUI22]|nr:two-component sensor histidine kinase [Cellulomonas sp. zg-ZUI22]
MTVDSPSTARRVWAHAWRLLVAIAVSSLNGLVVYGLVLTTGPYPGGPLGEMWMLVDLACLLLCAVAYVARHRAPRLVTSIIVVAGSFSLFSSFLVLFAVVSLAARRRRLETAAVCALWFVASLVGQRVFLAWVLPAGVLPDDLRILAAGQVLNTALAVVTGMFIGGRRALLASLREQAAIARREADARGDGARAAERNRIAHEMHDVLAHRLSLVALHAGALEYRAELDPEQVRETAAVVRQSAHEALGELREVLGLLRDTSATDEQSRPQPTFAQVGELIEGVRAAGSPVTSTLDRLDADTLAELPVATSRHLYRVAQQALANARAHAPGAPVHVRVHGAPGGRVVLEVTHPVPGPVPTTLPGSGWGLTGLAERLRLAGGELDAGVRPDGTVRVHAWLPWSGPTDEREPSGAAGDGVDGTLDVVASRA